MGSSSQFQVNTTGNVTATTINKVTITAPTSSATLTLVDGSTLATSGANSITLTSTGSTNVTLPTTGTLATLSGTETLSNKRINPRVNSVASSATPSPNSDNTDQFEVTALAANAAFANPSGTPVDGQVFIIRIKDAGTAKTLSFGTAYRAGDIALPTTTVISKTMYLGFIYNGADSKWDLVAYIDNF